MFQCVRWRASTSSGQFLMSCRRFFRADLMFLVFGQYSRASSRLLYLLSSIIICNLLISHLNKGTLFRNKVTLLQNNPWLLEINTDVHLIHMISRIFSRTA